MQKTSAKFQNNRWKTVRGVAPTRYSLSIHFDRISCKQKTKFTKQKKWEKIFKVLYPNHMPIFIPCKKHLHSFKSIGGKLLEESRPQDTLCLYTLIAFHVKFTQQKKWEKKSNYYTKTTCTSSFHAENSCNVAKQSVENCKRSCAHKVPTVYTLW